MVKDAVVIKTIDLNADDYMRMRAAFHIKESVHNNLTQLFLAAIEDVEMRISIEWDRAAKLAGYDDLEALHLDGHTLKIDWPTRSLHVCKRDKP